MSIVHIWCQLVFAIHFFSRTPTSLLICVLIILHTENWPKIPKQENAGHFSSISDAFIGEVGQKRLQVQTSVCYLPQAIMFCIWPFDAICGTFWRKGAAADEGLLLSVHQAHSSWGTQLKSSGVNGVAAGGRDEGIGGVSLHIAQYLGRMMKIAQCVDQIIMKIAQYLDRMIKIAQSVDQINCTVCGSNNN